MKHKLLIFVLFTTTSMWAESVSSPSGRITADFHLNADGQPLYSISFDNNEVIKASPMGFKLKQGLDLTSDFKVSGVEKNSYLEKWKPVWGEVREITDNHNELRVHLKQVASDNKMDIVFRVFDDGVGFRYEFEPNQHLAYFQVVDEVTSFCLTGDHKTFWIPGNDDSVRGVELILDGLKKVIKGANDEYSAKAAEESRKREAERAQRDATEKAARAERKAKISVKDGEKKPGRPAKKTTVAASVKAAARKAKEAAETKAKADLAAKRQAKVVEAEAAVAAAAPAEA